MAKVKGCLTKSCIAYEKKIHYKKEDEFCSKCGKELRYVCKKCHVMIDKDSKGSLCIRCAAVKKDRWDKIKKNVGKVGVGALAVGGTALEVGKKIVKK